MFKFVPSFFYASVLAAFCQGHPSFSTSFRHERSLDITLPRLVVIPRTDYRYNHESVNTITDRVRRDVPPSASYPSPGGDFYGPPAPAPSGPSTPPQYKPPPGPMYYVPPPQELGNMKQSNDYNGNFNYNYEDENGTNVQVKGYPKTLNNGEVVQAMEGQYSYTAPDGTFITTTWFADETGFHAEGAHIPG